MKKASERINIEVLLNNLDKEAELLAAQSDSPNQFRPYEIGVPLSFSEPVIADPFVFKVKSEYECEDFLRFDDAEFVRCAYRGLLRREADENGMTEYLVRLRRGEDKIMILAGLMRSEEGRKQAVRVKGMAPYVLALKLLRKRAIGVFLKPTIDLCMSRPQVMKRIAGLRADLNQMARAEAANYKNITETSLAQFERMMADANEERARLQKLSGQLVDLLDQLAVTQRDQAEIKGQFNDDQRSRQRLLDKLADQPAVAVDAGAGQIPSVSASNDRLDSFYRAFEDGCRGSEEEIKALFEVYLPDVRAAVARRGEATLPNPAVIDIGCGRGEWLRLLQEQTLSGLGIDSNESMVERCLELGVAAKQADGLTYLRSLPENSVVAITGFHIIEHVPFVELFYLFDEAYRVLLPGGLIIFETPNPENILVGSHTFYHDPSHRNPITPTFVRFLANFLGFTDIEIRRLHPYPKDAMVKGIDPLTERVNGHLCGPQDFSILAQKP
jgi:O-antigen chain-terminating methyltransferase